MQTIDSQSLTITMQDLKKVLSPTQIDDLFELYEARKSKTLQSRIQKAQTEKLISPQDLYSFA